MMFNDAERDNREKRRKKGKYLALVLVLKDIQYHVVFTIKL